MTTPRKWQENPNPTVGYGGNAPLPPHFNSSVTRPYTKGEGVTLQLDGADEAHSRLRATIAADNGETLSVVADHDLFVPTRGMVVKRGEAFDVPRRAPRFVDVPPR